MSKKIQLSIHEPCHENWDAMTPVDKGKFCGSCQKQVVDFSNMTDSQVAQFFKKPSTGSICGRFMSDQLDRDIMIPKKRLPWFKYFFQILLPAFFITKAGAQKIGKVSARPETRDTTRTNINHEMRTLGLIAPRILPECKTDTNLLTVKGEIDVRDRPAPITGIIMDEKGNIINGASIAIKGTYNSTVSRKDGSYKLTAKMGDILVISAEGYESKEITLGFNNQVNVTLYKVCVVIAGMIAIDRTPKKNPQKDPEPKKPEIVANEKPGDIIELPENPVPATSLIKLYPNPLRNGDEISIEFKIAIEGNFRLQWVDLSGRIISQEEFLTQSKRKLFQSTVPLVSAGSYFMVITDRKTAQRVSEKIVIQ